MKPVFAIFGGNYLKCDLLAYILLAKRTQRHTDQRQDVKSTAWCGQMPRGCANVRNSENQPDRTEETEIAKGSVMAVQVHPVETEIDSQSVQRKPAAERKQGDHNLINLWDECADVGSGVAHIRDRKKSKKDD